MSAIMRLNNRARAGMSLAGVGVLLVAAFVAILFAGVPAAYALDDPSNSNKELLCHNLNGPPQPSDGISVDKSAVVTAHPDAGHNFDIIEGQYSDALGRIAVAADIAIIGGDGSITWVCGDSTATTTTTTVAATTTTVGGPSSTTTVAATTTTVVGGPCNPAEEECLPNTGAAGVLLVLLPGLGILFLGVGILMVSDERRRVTPAS